MDIFEAEVARRFVVAVEKIANALDRKTESSSEKPNNCKDKPTGYNLSPVETEPQTEREDE